MSTLHLHKSKLDNENNVLLLLIPALVFFLTLLFAVVLLRSSAVGDNQVENQQTY